MFAIDRPIANENADLALQGTFEDGTIVNFPGGVTMPLDVRGEHSASTRVPPEATAGDLTITTRDGTSAPVPFRRASFEMYLNSFTFAGAQTDTARAGIDDPLHSGAAAVTLGDHVYLLGGASGAVLTNDIDLALGGADGTITKPRHVAGLQMPRAFHTAVRVLRWVYVIGGVSGNGPNGTVERAAINNDNTLGQFEIVPNVMLVTPRSAHASAIIGNYIYVIGGRTDAGELDNVERAPIYEDGNIGTFEPISEVKMHVARSNFSIAQLGNRLFVIGGLHAGVPDKSVEQMELYGDGYISSFEPAGELLEGRAHHVSVVIGSAVYVIGGAGTTGTLATVEVSGIELQTTLSFSPSPTYDLAEPKQDATLSVVGNDIYVIGGFRYVTGTPTPSSFIEHASFVAAHDLDSFAVLAGTQLQIARAQHTSVVIGNKLYVIGGLGTAGNAIAQTEVAEIKPDGTLGTFSIDPSGLMIPRYGHQMFTINNKLYVVGGTDQDGNLLRSIEAAEIYQNGELGPFSNLAAQLLAGRADFAIFGTGNYVFFAGGTVAAGATDTLEYVYFTDGTQLGGPMTYSTTSLLDTRAGARAVMLFGPAVHVIGGADGGAYRGDVAATLDPKIGGLGSTFIRPSWSPKVPRQGHSLMMVGNSLYVIGGATVNGNTSTIEKTRIDVTEYETLSAMLAMPRKDATTASAGNFVYVVGGTVGTSSTSTIEFSTIRR